MKKNDYWQLFRKTGKIEYYLEYKKACGCELYEDFKNTRNSNK